MRGSTRPFSRRGVTLAESLIATILLATCVVSIAGALTASYQNQNYATARRAASVAGRKLMENAAALPLDPATAGQASLSDYQQSTQTTVTTNALAALLSSLTFNLIKFPSATVTTTTTTTTSGTPAISVDRRATLNGTSSTTGDFAVVTITVPTQTSTTASSTVTFKRLVTSVEAAANQAK